MQSPPSRTASTLFAQAQQTEFYRKLTAGVDCAARYEDATLQAQARAAMPVAEMEKRALEKLDQIKVRANTWKENTRGGQRFGGGCLIRRPQTLQAVFL